MSLVGGDQRALSMLSTPLALQSVIPNKVRDLVSRPTTASARPVRDSSLPSVVRNDKLGTRPSAFDLSTGDRTLSAQREITVSRLRLSPYCSQVALPALCREIQSLLLVLCLQAYLC